MNEMVANIRDTGNQNIIVVPAAEQGQDASKHEKRHKDTDNFLSR
jgi:hypothetical protein